MLPRRRLLQSALGGLAVGRRAAGATAPAPRRSADRERLLGVARVVLPTALGEEGRAATVDAFLAWLDDYRAGAERDHGYGVTALRVLPASPAVRYPAQLDDLDRRAGGSLRARTDPEQRRVVTEAIEAARIRDLPARPDGAHVATDLMSFFFRGARANDLVHGRAIGRNACRELDTSAERPAVLTGDARR